MESCNSSNFTTLSNVTPCVIDSFGALGSILLLFIIAFTPNLKNYSGLLMAGEQLSCLAEQLFSLGVTIATQSPETTAKGVLFALTQTSKNISLVLLMLINCNLYLAIYKATSYRTMVTWKRVLLVMTMTLLVNIPLGMVSMFYRNYFLFDCSRGGIPSPNSTPAIMWHPVLYLIQAVVTLSLNTVFLIQITRRKGLGGSETDNKIRLARFIFILAIMYTFTYIGMYGLFYSQLPLTKLGTDVDGALLIFLNLNKIYVNLRLIFYLILYKPLRDTVKRCFRLCNRRVQPVETMHLELEETARTANERPVLPPVDIT